jgi:hypothetical protein
MRFQVPQFIEVEDKIFGPLTFKQFIYIAGSVGIAVVLYALFPHFLAIVIGLPVIIFGVALAFFIYNGKPFIYTVEAFVKYLFGSRLYIWKKEEKKPVANNEQRAINAKEPAQVYVPKLSQSKLKDLSWSLDIQENKNPVTNDEKEI